MGGFTSLGTAQPGQTLLKKLRALGHMRLHEWPATPDLMSGFAARHEQKHARWSGEPSGNAAQSPHRATICAKHVAPCAAVAAADSCAEGGSGSRAKLGSGGGGAAAAATATEPSPGSADEHTWHPASWNVAALRALHWHRHRLRVADCFRSEHVEHRWDTSALQRSSAASSEAALVGEVRSAARTSDRIKAQARRSVVGPREGVLPLLERGMVTMMVEVTNRTARRLRAACPLTTAYTGPT